MHFRDIRDQVTIDALHRSGQWATPESRSQLTEFFNIARRRAALITAITIFGMMGAGAVSLLIPIKYTAKSQIIIDPQKTLQQMDSNGEQPVDDPGSANRQRDEAAIESMVDTHVASLTSAGFLRQVLDSMEKNGEPPLKASASTESAASKRETPPPQNADQSQPDNAVTGRLEKMKARFKTWSALLFKKDDRVNKLLDVDDPESKLKVLRERRSHIITIGYIADDPKLAAAFANRVAQVYVDYRERQKRESILQKLKQIEERIAVLKEYASSASRRATKIISHPSEDLKASGVFHDQRVRELLTDAASVHLTLPKLEQQKSYLGGLLNEFKSDAQVFAIAQPPSHPSSMNPFLFILPALIVFLNVGVWSAVLWERADRKLRSESEISRASGLPCLGFVPEVRTRGKALPHQYLFKQPFSAYAEAIRSVVVSLDLNRAAGGPKSLLVCSPTPAEGKTTLAVSLAAYGAILKKRIILLDVDFWRSSILQELQLMPAAKPPELSPNTDALHSAIRHIPSINCDYIAVRSPTAEPLSLFAKDGLPKLLRELGELYDCVIIDGPPLSVSAEARMLANCTDKTVITLRWGALTRDTVESAVNMLRHPGPAGERGAVLAGVIVTRVNLAKHTKYGFGDAGEQLDIYRRHYAKQPQLQVSLPPLVESPAKERAIRNEALQRVDS